MPETVGSYFPYNCAGDKPLFYQVKPITALLYSIATWGLYSYWWHYQNWHLIKNNAESTISPLARSAFHPLFAYSLYDQISETASSLNVRGAVFLRTLGILHVLSAGFWFEPFFDLFPIFSMLVLLSSIFDLVFVQWKVIELNRALGLSIDNKFETIDLVPLFLIASQVLAFYLVMI